MVYIEGGVAVWWWMVCVVYEVWRHGGGIEVRWCGCDDGGSHGGVENEARGGAWSGRSDRSGGGESFGTRPENSPEKFSGGQRYMALAEENDDVRKEGARNGEWVKISMRKVQTLLEMEDNDDRKNYLDYLILLAESHKNTTKPLVAIIDSSATDYDSADESSVCSTPLPLLENLDGAEPVSGPKIIKSILKSKL
ncbi:hypothetical protein Tco_0047745 [Tanacetum coccineum]